MSGRLELLFGALALILAGAGALHGVGWFELGHVVGWQIAVVFVVFFAAAIACARFPLMRFRIVLTASLLQLLALHGPILTTGALLIWSAFYLLIHWRAPWWARLPGLAALVIAPALLTRFDVASVVVSILLVSHTAGNFVLRGPLYAYEATWKKPQLKGAGFAGYLLGLIAGPLGALSAAPIGWVALHRGLGQGTDPPLIERGIRQILLGFAYVVARTVAVKQGLFPDEADLFDVRGELNSLTALAGCHLVLLHLFLDVAGNVHVAVGMLRVLGFDIAPGSDRPYEARNILQFWRRWNTYYRDFLMTFAYYPIVMTLKKRPYLAIAVAGQATFLLMALSHALRKIVLLPGPITVRGLLGGSSMAVAYGIMVTAWMLKEARESRHGRRRPGEAIPERSPALGKVKVFVSSAVTTTLLSAAMVALARPAGTPRVASLELLAAFFRLPRL